MFFIPARRGEYCPAVWGLSPWPFLIDNQLLQNLSKHSDVANGNSVNNTIGTAIQNRITFLNKLYHNLPKEPKFTINLSDKMFMWRFRGITGGSIAKIVWTGCFLSWTILHEILWWNRFCQVLLNMKMNMPEFLNVGVNVWFQPHSPSFLQQVCMLFCHLWLVALMPSRT